MEQFDSVIKELFFASISMFFLSMFISIFDRKIARFLKLVAYLNGLSIVLIIGIKVWALANNFIDALNNLANWRLFGG